MSLLEAARCFSMSRVLQRFLDGEADDLTAARVAEHLEECRRCGLQAQTYRAIKQALRTKARDAEEPALRRLRAFHLSLAQSDDPTDPD